MPVTQIFGFVGRSLQLETPLIVVRKAVPPGLDQRGHRNTDAETRPEEVSMRAGMQQATAGGCKERCLLGELQTNRNNDGGNTAKSWQHLGRHDLRWVEASVVR